MSMSGFSYMWPALWLHTYRNVYVSSNLTRFTLYTSSSPVQRSRTGLLKDNREYSAMFTDTFANRYSWHGCSHVPSTAYKLWESDESSCYRTWRMLERGDKQGWERLVYFNVELVTISNWQLKHLKRERLACFNWELTSSSDWQLKHLKRLKQGVGVIETIKWSSQVHILTNDLSLTSQQSGPWWQHSIVEWLPCRYLPVTCMERFPGLTVRVTPAGTECARCSWDQHSPKAFSCENEKQ